MPSIIVRSKKDFKENEIGIIEAIVLMYTVVFWSSN